MSKKHHKHEDGLTEQEEQDLPADYEPETEAGAAEAAEEEPAPQPQEELPFQPGAGLYDEPPAEKPAIPTLEGFIFHSSACWRTTRMASWASARGMA